MKQISPIKFRHRRSELKMTQSQLCDGITSQATISKIEQDGIFPSADILEKLLERLGFTREDAVETNPTNLTLLKEMHGIVMKNPRKVLHKIGLIREKSLHDFFELRLYRLIHAKLNLIYSKQDDALFRIGEILENHNGIKDETFYAAKALQAKIYQFKGKLEIASRHFADVEAFLDQINNNRLANNHYLFAGMHLDVIDFHLERKDFQKARVRLEKALSISIENNDLKQTMDLGARFVEVFKLSGEKNLETEGLNALKFYSRISGDKDVLDRHKDYEKISLF
jgi:transcriptional regulator with XRE-family HTH domain